MDLLVAEAETDRQLATVDRVESAMDRLAAVQDRVSTLAAPLVTGIDPETGALTAGEGLWVLAQLLALPDVPELEAALVDLAPLLARGSGSHGLSAATDDLRGSLTHRDLLVRWTATQFLVVLVARPPEEEFPAPAAKALAGLQPLQFVRHGPGASLEAYLDAVVGPGPSTDAR